MKAIGIIAEYNPFHNGHAYQIEKNKQETGADYVVIAMSGNFVQRGAPALLDKYSRAQMALSCGADLVLELPVLFAVSSAEHFAKGGVSLLHHTGVVTHLGFGMEHHYLPTLQNVADVLLRQPEAYQAELRKQLKNGLSYPHARSRALEAYFIFQKPGFRKESPQQHLQEILASPNNILAIEYLKALSYYKSAMIPCPVLRQGNGYHNTALDHDFCSASAIRAFLKERRSACPLEPLANTMPKAAYTLLGRYPHPFLFEDDFSTLIHYKLLTDPVQRIASYADSSLPLANRIKKMAPYFVSWSGFCQLLKTKNVTYTRLSRLLLHMLLQICQEDFCALSKPSYLRVLGFRKSAAPLLSAIKKQGSLPLLTNLSKDSKRLPATAQKLLSYDLDASNLYHLIQHSKEAPCARSLPIKNEYQQPILCL